MNLSIVNKRSKNIKIIERKFIKPKKKKSKRILRGNYTNALKYCILINYYYNCNYYHLIF